MAIALPADGKTLSAATPVPGSAPRLADSSIERLYRDYRDELCRKLRRMFGSGPPDPEDAAQTAFVRLASMDDPGRVLNPRAFLFTTARNIVLDHKRSQGVQFEYARNAIATGAHENLDELTPEHVYLHRERFEIVRRTLEKLPEKQKVVLNLHRNHGYTYQQIARETGWSYGDVHRQMDAALATLMDALKR